jgi:hypothetical protein
MIKFVLNNNLFIEIDESQTIMELKNKIMNLVNIKKKNIDIYCNIDKPIRGLGKLTFEKGLLLRNMDNYTLSRFNINNREIHIDYKIIDKEYIQNISKNNNILTGNGGKYIPPYLKNKIQDEGGNNLIINDLNFPKLN